MPMGFEVLKGHGMSDGMSWKDKPAHWYPEYPMILQVLEAKTVDEVEKKVAHICRQMR